jgi:hypothetical protein
MSAELFDEYRGPGVPEGKKSLARPPQAPRKGARRHPPRGVRRNRSARTPITGP